MFNKKSLKIESQRCTIDRLTEKVFKLECELRIAKHSFEIEKNSNRFLRNINKNVTEEADKLKEWAKNCPIKIKE